MRVRGIVIVRVRVRDGLISTGMVRVTGGAGVGLSARVRVEGIGRVGVRVRDVVHV